MKDDLALQSTPDGGTMVREDSGGRRVPLGMVQKTMAKRMLQSAREIPQFSVSRELDAELLGVRRARINAEIDDDDRRVSVTALLIWLTALALRKHPRMNSRFDEDAAIQHEQVNMAVAMDTPYGLVAPVIHGAEALSVADTAVALNELAARAMEKRLTMNDFADATFTTSNLGMFGISGFTPLVNPPQGRDHRGGSAAHCGADRRRGPARPNPRDRTYRHGRPPHPRWSRSGTLFTNPGGERREVTNHLNKETKNND